MRKIFTFIIASVLVNSAMAVTTIADGSISIRPTPCTHTVKLGLIPNNVDIDVLETRFVWGGAIGVEWYKINYNGVSGWVSSQNFKNAPKPIFDRLKIGKKCRY